MADFGPKRGPKRRKIEYAGFFCPECVQCPYHMDLVAVAPKSPHRQKYIYLHNGPGGPNFGLILDQN